ncbi:unnamed protein product [Prunus armeniaca]|uniref:Uncharacterized protein n=1 Tax=Prunus armeniaca TaxID=36596 RepID=A0A6J5TIU2_PRUAR|nr:unnamed protein product [Prunus armeniaca]CAB4294083.1 unnamed protein product [Prunus armeniaca]
MKECERIGRKGTVEREVVGPTPKRDVNHPSLDGKVVDTSEGVDPPILATKVARVVGSVKVGGPVAPASLVTVQELVKETESSEEQIQAQNGLEMMP